MTQDVTKTKKEILRALKHPEAEDGLYLENLYIIHEEEERPAVNASEDTILEALQELIGEGRVRVSEVEGKMLCVLETSA